METAIDDDLFRRLLVDKALTELDPSVPNLPLRAEPQTLSLKIPNRSFHHKHRVKLAKGTYGGGTTGLSVRKGRLTRQSISGLGEHAEALLGLSPQEAGSKFPGEEADHSVSLRIPAARNAGDIPKTQNYEQLERHPNPTMSSVRGTPYNASLCAH